MKKGLLFILGIFICFQVWGQDDVKTEKVTIKGKVMTALVSDGDTVILADLDDVSITSPRSFSSVEDYRKYQYYRKCANKVYPYAKEAIKIFREVEESTQDMNKRKKKRHNKKLQKQLKKEFSDPLKKLSRTQGKVLVKMIERELDTPMYILLRNLRGSVTAEYWNQISKIYGYKLKRGYVVGDDTIMDAVLQDFDISYDFD